MQNQPHTIFSRVITLAALTCLLVSIVVGIGPNWSSRLMGIGGNIWDNYAKDLRSDPQKPECDVRELETRVAECKPAEPTATPDVNDDPFADAPSAEEDPFADAPSAEEDPFADAPSAEEDPFADAPSAEEDPFADAPSAEEDPFADAPSAEEDPFADAPSAEKDPLAKQQKSTKPKRNVNCAALKALKNQCETQHEKYAALGQRITPTVRMYRTLEFAISEIGSFPYSRHLLLLFLGLSGFITTRARAHISIRNPQTQIEHRVSEGAMLLGHLLLTSSAVVDLLIQETQDTEVANPLLPYIMVIAFGGMGLINLHNLVKVSLPSNRPSNIARILMVIPLHAYMAIITAAYFILVEFHPSGQAIYVHKFAQHPNVYLGIGLYIWSGMLLANTRIATRLFDILTPWNLPPSILAWLVVVLAAYPTAYSGASGIFVIATGAVIFSQMKAAGSSSRLALTATAMSGSLGVVLNPCLVIVLIAILNKQVTTSELFGMGRWVFALTAGLFLLAMLVHWALNGFERPRRTSQSFGERLKQSGSAILGLMPYVGVATVVFAGFWFITDTTLNERTAPYVLPVLMLSLVYYDKWSERREGIDAVPFKTRIMDATTETTHHSGALLMVMVTSVGIGGLIERSGVMEIFPSTFDSPVTTMAILVCIMVLVGMTMDALGAVVLVSVSVANLAYANGIDPIHFWMMVLVAFELGYLTPPVAINHLLARQVIGEDSWVENDDTVGFMARYEHIVVPMIVMGTALLIVGFVPFIWYP